MQSDAMRGHACAELRLWCSWGVLIFALDLSGCSPEGSRTDDKSTAEQSSGTPPGAVAGDGPKIGVGGRGTVNDNGNNMIVETLPPGGPGALPAAEAGAGAATPAAAGVGASGNGNAAMTTTSAGAPSMSMAGGPPAASGGGGTGGPTMGMTYPPLDGAAIGMPTQVAMGFSLAESPVWDPCNDRLLFADVSAAGGGVINALGADGKVTQFMAGTGNTNGLAWDVDGSLLLAQMSGHLARRDRMGMVTEIDNGGLKLHTPDDLVVRSDGTIYLSDGNFCPAGALLGYNDALPVYTIKPGVMAWVNSGTVKGPNGIELSPDEKYLYVNGYGEGSIYRFDVMPDGTIMKPAKPFVTGLADPDSMCLDAAGNLYVAVTSGIQVLRPDGSKVKLIPISGRAGSCTKAGMTNCTFGGPEGKTLYVTSWTALYKIDDMPIPGLDFIVGKQRARCN